MARIREEEVRVEVFFSAVFLNVAAMAMFQIILANTQQCNRTTVIL